jgi:hypothetical protein
MGRKNCTEAWACLGLNPLRYMYPTPFRCSSASGLSGRASRNAEILALRILAEIDLNPAHLYRDTFIKLVWSFAQKIPLPDSTR